MGLLGGRTAPRADHRGGTSPLGNLDLAEAFLRRSEELEPAVEEEAVRAVLAEQRKAIRQLVRAQREGKR